MVGPKSKRFILLVLLMALAVGAYWVIRNWKAGETDQNQDLSGEYTFQFFYSNDSMLVFKGRLLLEIQDSISLTIEVTPPRSTRLLRLKSSSLKQMENELSGILIYDSYLIQGGNPREEFNWIFEKDGSFHGTGRCLEFCPEGTESAVISWTGLKNQNL